MCACVGDEENCCLVAPYLYKFIQTPIFISENTADSYQVFTQGRSPDKMTPDTKSYIEYLLNILATSLKQQVMRGKKAKSDGLFAPACLAHAIPWNGNKAATVNGKNLQMMFGDWYFGRGGIQGSYMEVDNSTSIAKLQCCESKRGTNALAEAIQRRLRQLRKVGEVQAQEEADAIASAQLRQCEVPGHEPVAKSTKSALGTVLAVSSRRPLLLLRLPK
jgi:hypothetical protein